MKIVCYYRLLFAMCCKAGDTRLVFTNQGGGWRNPLWWDIVFWQLRPLLPKYTDQQLKPIGCSCWWTNFFQHVPLTEVNQAVIFFCMGIHWLEFSWSLLNQLNIDQCIVSLTIWLPRWVTYLEQWGRQRILIFLWLFFHLLKPSTHYKLFFCLTQRTKWKKL